MLPSKRESKRESTRRSFRTFCLVQKLISRSHKQRAKQRQQRQQYRKNKNKKKFLFSSTAFVSFSSLNHKKEYVLVCLICLFLSQIHSVAYICSLSIIGESKRLTKLCNRELKKEKGLGFGEKREKSFGARIIQLWIKKNSDGSRKKIKKIKKPSDRTCERRIGNRRNGPHVSVRYFRSKNVRECAYVARTRYGIRNNRLTNYLATCQWLERGLPRGHFKPRTQLTIYVFIQH